MSSSAPEFLFIGTSTQHFYNNNKTLSYRVLWWWYDPGMWNGLSHCAVVGTAKKAKNRRCPSCILAVICSFTALRGSWHSGNFHSAGSLSASILQAFTDPLLPGSLLPGANFNHPVKEVLSIVVSCTCDCLWVLFLLSFWNANSLSPRCHMWLIRIIVQGWELHTQLCLVQPGHWLCWCLRWEKLQ